MSNLNTAALLRYIEEIENYVGQRKRINDDIRGVYHEIKEAGMDPETVRQMVRERALDPEVRADQYRLRNEYRGALGLFADTPLGQAASYSDGDDLDEPSPTTRPRPFSEQTVHPPRRARAAKPRLRLFDAENPQGAA